MFSKCSSQTCRDPWDHFGWFLRRKYFSWQGWGAVCLSHGVDICTVGAKAMVGGTAEPYHESQQWHSQDDYSLYCLPTHSLSWFFKNARFVYRHLMKQEKEQFYYIFTLKLMLFLMLYVLCNKMGFRRHSVSSASWAAWNCLLHVTVCLTWMSYFMSEYVCDCLSCKFERLLFFFMEFYFFLKRMAT